MGMEVGSVIKPIIHRIQTRGRRRVFVCNPKKIESIVDFMEKWGRARERGEISCEECLKAAAGMDSVVPAAAKL